MTVANASRIHASQLVALDLRPLFVGIHHDMLNAAIMGNLEDIRDELLVDRLAGPPPARTDRAGSWIIPLKHAPEIREET